MRTYPGMIRETVELVHGIDLLNLLNEIATEHAERKHNDQISIICAVE